MLNKLNLGILIDFILGLWCQTLSNNKGDNKLVYRCAGNIMSFPLSINNFMELLILMFKCLLSIIFLELTSVFNHYSWSICSASLETLSKMSWTAYTFSNTIGDHVYSPQVVWLLHDSVHNDTNGALINYNYSRSRYATNLYLNLLLKSNEFASKCCSFLSLWEMDSYFKVNRSELLSKLVRFKCSASLKSFSEAQDQRCQNSETCELLPGWVVTCFHKFHILSLPGLLLDFCKGVSFFSLSFYDTLIFLISLRKINLIILLQY